MLRVILRALTALQRRYPTWNLLKPTRTRRALRLRCLVSSIQPESRAQLQRTRLTRATRYINAHGMEPAMKQFAVGVAKTIEDVKQRRKVVGRASRGIRNRHKDTHITDQALNTTRETTITVGTPMEAVVVYGATRRIQM